MVSSFIVRRCRSTAALLCLALITATVPVKLFAQTASQITPKSFAPPVQRQPGHGFSLGAAPGLDTPPGAERLSVTLAGVTIEGGFPSLSAEAGAARRKLTGKRITGADIFAAARALEASYAQAGYVLARVLLPPQRLDDGATLKLRVVNGYISSVEIKNLPRRVRARIAALVKPLEGVRGLTLRRIERQILLASDVPGIILRSTLAPGARLGETILVLNATYQPVTYDMGVDNTLGSGLGSYQISLGATFNSLLGLGEQVYVHVAGNPGRGAQNFFADHPLNRSLAAGIIVPVGPDGMTFNLEATDAHTTPDAVAGTQPADAFFRLSLRLRYAWLRSRNADFASQIVFDAQNEQEELIAPRRASLFEDRLRVLRFVQEGDAILPIGGTVSGNFTTSFGIAGLGARLPSQATPNLPLSRLGAAAGFTKIDGTIDYTRPLTQHIALDFVLRGQYAFSGVAMERAEQIGIAGAGALSAFDTGTLQGDSGFVARAEFSRTFPLHWHVRKGNALLTPYVFIAGGEVFRNHPTALETGHTAAGAYGLGLRFNRASAQSLASQSVSLEFARQIESGPKPDDNRVTVSAALRF